MTTIESPRLCGGTFFRAVLDSRKQRHGSRQRFIGEKDGLSDPEVLISLIKVIDPGYEGPTKSEQPTFKGNVSEYKNCKVSKSSLMPFGDTAEVRAFDACVRGNYEEALVRMAAFTSAFIDVGKENKKDEYLVEALVGLIIEDASILPDTQFFVCEDGKPTTKRELDTAHSFCLESVLVGVWHYIQLHRQDNTVGRVTVESEWKTVRRLSPINITTHVSSPATENTSAEKDEPLDHETVEAEVVDPVEENRGGETAKQIKQVVMNNYRMTDHGNKNDYIKQFFCLTHNPFFFKEITYNRVAENECVNLYELKKLEHNQSVIKPCTHADELVGGGQVNYSPVKNTYDALWAEYRTATDAISLMNVTRRILEYYFLQICGYSSGDLRTDLLENHRLDFETIRPDGAIDKTDYNLASAMVAVLNVGAREFNDGLFFDASAVETTQLRTVFQKIFFATGQEQHYNMMMGL